MNEIKNEDEVIAKALLATIDIGDYDVELSLDELEELVKTAGAEVVARITQKRQSPKSATCIGSGKLAEIALFVQNLQVDLVIFDLELSGSQIRNIEQAVECRVIDRTMLILDIFAQRAHTAEGQLQVELAQQRYRMPRLSGQGIALSRLGGGIGTRGPGETKLESDRRHIRRRIESLEEQLEEVSKRRAIHRDRRKKNDIPTVALLGYTNVGKSTLLNTLTQAGVLAENMLFATLDPTARGLVLPDGRTVMLVDTVGLIRRLPHALVKAFRSTLEEACQADLVLNMCDISSPDAQVQLEVTKTLLSELDAGDVKVLHVLNKADKLDVLPITIGEDCCVISAKTGKGLEQMLDVISKALTPTHTRVSILLPYDKGGLLAEVRQGGKIFSESYTETGTLVDIFCDNKILHKFKDFIQN